MKKSIIILFLIIALLVLATYVYAGVDKITWCHCEPNGNCQTLELPQQALENAGHVNAQGNPLHAGDHAGACVQPSTTPTPTDSVTPTASPSATLAPTSTPSATSTTTPQNGPTATPGAPQGPTATPGPQRVASTPTSTLIPCSPNTCGWK